MIKISAGGLENTARRASILAGRNRAGKNASGSIAENLKKAVPSGLFLGGSVAIAKSVAQEDKKSCQMCSDYCCEVLY